MTALRQSAMKELERMPEDKITFILQIMQGINGLYEDKASAKKNAFMELERLRKPVGNVDDAAELADYRDEKYGK